MLDLTPFRVERPAIVSFSGGRTSGMLVWGVLQAYEGRLPEDVHVVFANTGKERPETLDFVREVEQRWNVPITWVEWRATPREAENVSLAAHLAQHDPEGRLVSEQGFEVVGGNSAHTAGEPFAAVIALKQRLPNWKERWCTSVLKLQAIFAYATSLGHHQGAYTEVIGLRDDEGHRILKGMANAEKFGRRCAYPLAKAKVRKADVMAFWREQPFDLALQPWEGNCDLCFLKAKAYRKRIIRTQPHVAKWWDDQEVGRDQFFDRRDTVRDLINQVHRTPDMFDTPLPEDEHDTECGLLCGEGE